MTFFACLVMYRFTQTMEETDHRLQNELDLDPEKVIGLPEEQLMSYLSSRLKADSQLEQLADFLLQTEHDGGPS